MPRNSSNRSFSKFAWKVAESYKDRSQYNSYKEAIDHLLRFAGKRDIAFDSISPKFLENFRIYLQNSKSQKGGLLSYHTIYRIFSALRVIVKKYREFNKELADPFVSIRTKRPLQTREAVSAKEMESIRSLKLKKGSDLWHARNYFLFSYHLGGVSLADLSKLKIEHYKKGVLFYKVNTKPRSMHLSDEALDIFLLYKRDRIKGILFPLPEIKENESIQNYQIKQINRTLDTIGDLIGTNKKVRFFSVNNFRDYKAEAFFERES